MAEYIEREAAVAVIEEKQKELCPVGRYGRGYVYGSDREKYDAWDEIIDALESITAKNVAPVVHGTPMLRYRPERYERYEEQGLNENGEMLYLKRILVDEKSYAMYCPCCGKRLCSRFKDYCPKCGAKMDGGDNDA